MAELRLKYRDQAGYDQSVAVEREKFVIGRNSANDLAIPHEKLSRQHVRIERFGEVFVVSDLGSSNGTTLNGAALLDPVALKDGDVLNLGGDCEIGVELVAAPVKTRRAGAGGVSAASGGGAADESSIPTAVFIAAPVLALVLLSCGGGLFYFLMPASDPVVVRNTDYTPYTAEETPARSATPTPAPSDEAGSPTPAPSATAGTPPEASDETKRIAQHSSAFLSRIATNNPNAFLMAAQIDALAPKINELKNSSALAENLKAAKASSSQIGSLAESKGLTGQFLATAALAQLGNARGDPLATAQAMLPVFAGLRTSLANNLADESLLMIAAFNQGKAGEFRKLRNVMEGLALKNPGTSPREIRTIWFLRKQNRLSDAEFEFALRFLAVGTIAQNPKDFGVNAEAVVLN